MAREYPDAPVVGVGGVVVRDGRALVVRRAHEPRKGEWSIPGGLVHLGEPLTDAVRRELREEAGLDVDVGRLVEAFDRVHRDAGGRVRYHFVILDYLCTAPTGDAKAGDDAEAVAWIAADEIDRYGINAHAAAVLRRALTQMAPTDADGSG
jgi:ADP-ribose pyrophosphatase YjhB (NUDIX family)